MNNNIKQSVRVRFAPSPTGNLHLGGARTALFNWLFAKSHGGRFLLRIEDTDQVRSKEEFVAQICESLKWMRCNWNGEMVFQSSRNQLYKNEIEKLILSNSVYHCFCDKDKLAIVRMEREKAGLGFSYPGTCRKLSSDRVKDLLKENSAYVIRVKIPKGKTTFKDTVYGNITVDNKQLDDFIIARSDGSPTYNLTVVVDDNNMNITHIIRGEDHISNTPKQIILYNLLGYKIPQFAHLPMILGPDKKRLSKRHGATGVQEYRDKGFLSSAMVNYLALLGWNPGTEKEIFTEEELLSDFSIDRVLKKGAVFDNQKLEWINQQTILKMEAMKILDLILSIDKDWGKEKTKEYLVVVIDLLKPRCKTINDLIDSSLYFFSEPLDYDKKVMRKRWKTKDVNKLVSAYIEGLQIITQWKNEVIELSLRSLAEKKEINPSKLIHPVRLAISGTGAGPSLFHMMEVLGKVICIKRLKKAVDLLPIKIENDRI